MKTLKTFIPSLALSLLLLAGCAGSSKRVESVPTEQDHFAEIEGIPLVMNNRVQDWLDYFQGRGRERFELYLRRSGKYIPMMKKILRAHGLPQDLVYLSMIESGFNPHAYSRARATGAWQFIYRTGIRYGLTVNAWVDERRDPEKSTVAAAKYLKDLYDRYNNWYLAAAGYNAGEGKIDRAIRRYDTEDFWELAKMKYLKAETKNYVPKLIAAAMIAKNPERYGFTKIDYEEPILFDQVPINSPTDLRVIAQCSEISYDEVRTLNPEILQWITPLNTPEYLVKVPKGSADKFHENYAALTPEERLGKEKITVKTRTTVDHLAKHHGVPALLLAAANGLTTRSAVASGTTLTLPLDPPPGQKFREKFLEKPTRKRARGGSGGVLTYKVRGGDTIYHISRRTGIRVANLKKYNSHVNWGRLQKGQVLRLKTQKPQVRSASNT